MIIKILFSMKIILGLSVSVLLPVEGKGGLNQKKLASSGGSTKVELIPVCGRVILECASWDVVTSVPRDATAWSEHEQEMTIELVKSLPTHPRGILSPLVAIGSSPL